jgi:hypothetical protein
MINSIGKIELRKILIASAWKKKGTGFKPALFNKIRDNQENISASPGVILAGTEPFIGTGSKDN